MSEPFLGEIRPFPYSFAPKNWAFCNGQLLPIAQNQALFALLGTTYGGNGTTTFALPNLMDRIPISSGQGVGLAPYSLGQPGGSSTVALNTSQIPNHSHLVSTAGTPSTTSPVGAMPSTSATHPLYDPSVNTTMANDMIGITGSSQAHNNMQPTMAINYCIALVGIFPQRN